MYNQAKYDNDKVTLGQLKESISEIEEAIPDSSEYSKNFGLTPKPPYSVGDTWTDDGRVYKCVKERLYGAFSISDWQLVATDDSNFNQFVENVYTAYELSIPNQSDGKIESFYQDEDPSTEWDTDILKEIHNGDLWYSNSSGVQRRYTKKNTNPVSYSWNIVSVPMALFNLVDGHKNIFIVKPSEYSKDDYWVIDTEEDIPTNCQIGEIVIAINNSAVYNKEDFIKKDLKTIKVNAIEDEYYNKKEINVKNSELEKYTETKIQQAKDEISLEVLSTIKPEIITVEQIGEVLKLENTPNSKGAIKKLSIKGIPIIPLYPGMAYPTPYTYPGAYNHYNLIFSNDESFNSYEELDIESPIILRAITIDDVVISDELLIYENYVSIVQNVGYDNYGNCVSLDDPIIHELKDILVPTYYGGTYIKLKHINVNVEFNCEYIKKNELSDIFTTEIETRAAINISDQNIKSKVSRGNIISEINQSPELIKILADRIMLEGIVTANNNFKILLDGSIEAKNGRFFGNVYLPSGGQVIGGDGLLSNFQYETSHDFERLGFNYYYTLDKYIADTLPLSVYIPNNFKIKEAKVTLFHMPQRMNMNTDSGVLTEWCYSRNIKLYKVDLTNILWDGWIDSEFYMDESSKMAEITEAFGSTGYTPPIPSDSDYSTKTIISGDIKNHLKSGMNNLVLKCDYEINDSSTDVLESFIAYKYSGRVLAFLDIVGYMSTEEE